MSNEYLTSIAEIITEYNFLDLSVNTRDSVSVTLSNKSNSLFIYVRYINTEEIIIEVDYFRNKILNIEEPDEKHNVSFPVYSPYTEGLIKTALMQCSYVKTKERDYKINQVLK